MKVRSLTEELKGRVPDCTAEKASKATLQSHLDQYELVGQDLERELSSLTLLRQYALSLLHDVEVSVSTPDHEQLPSLKEIKAVQDILERSVIFLLVFLSCVIFFQWEYTVFIRFKEMQHDDRSIGCIYSRCHSRVYSSQCNGS